MSAKTGAATGNCACILKHSCVCPDRTLDQPDGSKLFIKGTNLGNWLNPEGYMFGFNKTNSGRFINEMFCQMVGPDFVAEFWKQFKDNYITRKDVEFIASTGANTIRLLSIINSSLMRTIWG